MARARGLHFLGLSEHGYLLNADRWEELRQAAEAKSHEGAFIALAGFEWTHREEGKIGVFGTETFISRDHTRAGTLKKFYRWLSRQDGAVAGFNRPGSSRKLFQGFRHNAVADGKMVLLEVGSGNSCEDTYRRFERELIRALGAGWHVGVSNGADTHTVHWAEDTSHRTGIVAPELSREALFAALRARRTFATEDENLALAMKTGDSWMGSVVNTATVGVKLPVQVVAFDPDEEPLSFTLYVDGAPSQWHGSSSLGLDYQWETEVSFDTTGEHSIFVKAVQADGDWVYTSPLWVLVSVSESEPYPARTSTPTAVPTSTPRPTSTSTPTPVPTRTPTSTPLPTHTPTLTPTPGKTVSIAEARRLDLGSWVKLKGQVTAPPGAFSQRYFYIQDQSAGIRVYLPRGKPPPLREGDWVLAEGRLAQYRGNLELVALPAGVVRQDAGQPLPPLKVEIGELSPELEGALVQVVGSVDGREGRSVWIRDRTGEITIYLRRGIGEVPNAFPQGGVVAVSGIVFRYEGSLQLHPRSARDIESVALRLPVTGGGDAPHLAMPLSEANLRHSGH